MEPHDLYALLHIAEKAQNWPKLHPLRDWAMSQLEKQADIVATPQASAPAEPAQAEGEQDVT
jgi:hypothetical protein